MHLRILAVAALVCALAAPAAAATHITFVTDWKAQAEHGGFYEAQALELYAKAGLDVKILEGGPSVNVPELLAGGAADFGIGSNGFIPLNMVRAGVPVRAVMAVFQKDPQVLITHPRGDVKSLADMKGKPIMIADASVTAFWPWLKARYGFSDTQIRKYTFNLAPFLVDPKAIQEGYLTSEPYTVQTTAHFMPQIFLLADNGYPGYANMVLVPQKWIDGNPKAVQAFVDATAEGWINYLDVNPGPANALIKKDNPEMSDGLIAQAIDKMKRYGLTTPMGTMTDARWKTFFDTMSSEGLYEKTLPYKNAYDLRFVNNMPKWVKVQERVPVKVLSQPKSK
jgi:NitT/TauT family transport system substrate-binding protein